MRFSQIKSISYLKTNAAEVLDRVAEKRESMLITQNGEAKAVIQDVASYEQTRETLALVNDRVRRTRSCLMPPRGGHT